MYPLTEASFHLRSIQLCSEEVAPAHSPSTVPASVPSTQVLLHVGGHPEPPLRYTCPAFIVQRGSATIRDILEDSLENADGAPSVSPPSSSSPAGSVVIPLPFLDKWVFEVVAVYLEHFFGLPDWHVATSAPPATSSVVGGSGSGGGLDGSGRGSALALMSDTPSALRRPLDLADLYALSPWEHTYVVYSVLGVPWSQITSLDLVGDGRWVDLAGGSVGRGKDGARATSQAAECFSVTNRQRMWVRLTAVLEAATRLGVQPLQLLCASVAADMTIDLDAAGVAQLVRGDEETAVARVVPPFTQEARASLLRQFPWLSREETTSTGAILK